jgi:hypothetical protein
MTLETGPHAAYLTVGDSDELEQSETDRLTAERTPGPRAVPHKTGPPCSGRVRSTAPASAYAYLRLVEP